MTTSFDDRLKTAIDDDDRDFLKRLEAEPGLFAQMGDAFTGGLKYWTGLAFAISLANLFLSVYAIIKIIDADNETQRIIWMALFVWGTVGVGLTKIWFWMRMNHIALLRELKRIQLQNIRLSNMD